MNKSKDLSNISLVELDILKNHAMIMLSKTERLMGNSRIDSSFEVKEFETVSNIYKIYEEEMWKRIKENALD